MLTHQDPHNRRQATHMLSTLNRLEAHGKVSIYQGTVNVSDKNKRRAANRVAAKSRRTNRGKR